MSDHERVIDDNYEPWFYCATCFSPSIKYDENIDLDCCSVCGSTDIVECSFEEWERKYEKRYGKKYTEKNNDPSKSPVFQMSLSRLMHKVSDCPKWEVIISSLYNHFPKGLSKADSVVLFFDKLVKDNKLDSLRNLLYKMKI